MNNLRNLLKENIIEIKFNKVDGNVRIMSATLKEEYLPIKEGKSCRNFSDDVISVWSVNDKGWRSFRKDSVISYEIKS